MPLINTVITVVLKQQIKGKVIVEESDGSRYAFDPGPDHIYIEGETLEIRVDGLEKSLELGGTDTLIGTVVRTELKPENAVKTPMKVLEEEPWKPVEQYGEEAAAALFPRHTEPSYRNLKLWPPIPVGDEYLEIHSRIRKYLDAELTSDAILEISSALATYPWMLDLYHILGSLSSNHQRLDEAEKYFEMGIGIAELSLAGEASPWIISGDTEANLLYHYLLRDLGNLKVLSGDRDGGLEVYRKAWRIDPLDYVGVRFILKELTGESHPAAEDGYPMSEIDPYFFFNRYDMPIPDSYDPMYKTDYKRWQKMSYMYTRLIVHQAHMQTFGANGTPMEEQSHHINLHQVAETALATGFPRDARMQLARHMARGVDRHDAIHWLGQVLIDMMRDNQVVAGEPTDG